MGQLQPAWSLFFLPAALVDVSNASLSVPLGVRVHYFHGLFPCFNGEWCGRTWPCDPAQVHSPDTSTLSSLRIAQTSHFKFQTSKQPRLHLHREDLSSMRVLFPFFWAFLATCAALNDTIVDVQEERDDMLSLRPLFRAWMKHHNISIPPSKIAHRLRIFAANHAFILSHNAQQHPRPSYTLGHNRFSHLTFDEFRAMHLGFTRPTTAFPPSFEEAETPQNDVLATSRSLRGHLSTTDKNHAIGMNTERFPPYTFPRPAWLPHIENPSSSLPPSIDWVEKGAVTPVKDQGQCGSCYSFSAVGAVEGAYYLQTGVLSEFSMQEIVDCDGLDGGCQGGEMQQTFKWMQMNGGLCLLSDYPYVSGTTAEEQAVCLPCPVVPGTAPEKWITVRRNSMTELQEAVAAQPVSVAVGASRAWMFYEAGVFDGKCEQELNHGVLCVGYGGGEGSEEGQYWKVKNSWGPEWGMEGYILLKRDDFDKQAACGIMEDASYPILPSVPGMTGNEPARPPVISQAGRSSGSSAGLNPLQDYHHHHQQQQHNNYFYPYHAAAGCPRFFPAPPFFSSSHQVSQRHRPPPPQQQQAQEEQPFPHHQQQRATFINARVRRTIKRAAQRAVAKEQERKAKEGATAAEEGAAVAEEGAAVAAAAA